MFCWNLSCSLVGTTAPPNQTISLAVLGIECVILFCCCPPHLMCGTYLNGMMNLSLTGILAIGYIERVWWLLLNQAAATVSSRISGRTAGSYWPTRTYASCRRRHLRRASHAI
ncbi:hypothetical protein BGX38DRAFT_1157028, partial [Terfezia claveryi]